MKILWFTNTPSLYDQGMHQYHGGGWIESLEELIRKRPEIQLGIAFFYPTDYKNEIRNGVHYYPILRQSGKKHPFRTLVNNWRGKIENDHYSEEFLKVIDEFKPDTIQIFGTEGAFGLVQELTHIPVLIHLQGLINPCLNTFFPIGSSRIDFVLNPKYLIKNILGSSPVFSYKRFKAQAKREKQILEMVNYVCGRTEWDRQIAELYNPQVRYFHVDEVLRPVFYDTSLFTKPNSNKKFIILSTLSPTIYKGIDVVLKSVQKLKELTDLNFEWRIIGLDSDSELLRFFQKKVGFDFESVQIKLLGKMSPDKMIDQMLDSDVFVHPSYIDNSPNSVCEAQILGLPVIACNVGGVGSLIEHMQTGILVPSNGVFEIVHYLKYLYENSHSRQEICKRGRETALNRHNRDKIVNALMNVYSHIIKKHAKTICIFL